MEIPNRDQFSRIFDHIEQLDELPASRIPAALIKLESSGEPQEVLGYLRLNYSLPPPPEFELKPGTHIAGRYTIREQIGAGGMGVVYRATQDRTERDVALKLIHPRLHTRELLKRFEEEIVTLAKLDHPGIVHLFDADTHEGTVFFTMQLLNGEPLHRHLRDNSLTRHQKLDIIIHLCDAVQAAHTRGIIHRDIKPANILIDRSTGDPVILDFGLAALAGQILGDGDGQISGLSGTPDYMSPEQFLRKAGEFGVGQSIDVYALGIIAFEILAGHRPYKFPPDSSWADKRRTVLESTPLHLDDDPELDEAVRKAIRKDPADRYFTASGFAKALRRIQDRLASPEDITPPAWAPSAGTRVPSTDWILDKKIGEGGIGQVWLANHPKLEEKHVFKFCEDPEKVRSLKREASLFRLLKEKIGQHPNIVRLHDVSLDDPPYFIAMDHITGGDLLHWSDSQGGIGNVPIETRIDLIAQAATTLQAAHDAGILHRDIKPSNLLVDDAGKVFIADFGIGQLVWAEELGNTKLGFTRTILDAAGTHRYTAPEIESGHPATVRSDIYSLGVVLYQAIVGDFNQSLTVDWYGQVDHPLLVEDLKRCFSGEPAERFSSAAQLADNLRTIGQRREADADRKAQERKLERRAYRQGIVRATGVAAMVVGVVGALGILAWIQGNRAKVAGATASLRSAISIAESGTGAGRQQEGLAALAQASLLDTELVSIRNTAASLLASDDLSLSTGSALWIANKVSPSFVTSSDGHSNARVSSENGLDASIMIESTEPGSPPAIIERKGFPWIPLPERGLLQFSPSRALIGIAGPATSMHLIVADTYSGEAITCLYAKDDLTCYCWHPDENIIATGHDDATIRIWRLRHASKFAGGGKEIDLPPRLDEVRTLDDPSSILEGHRGPVLAISFDQSGTYLASLDSADRLKIWSFPETGDPPEIAIDADLSTAVEQSRFAELNFETDTLIIHRDGSPTIEANLHRSQIFMEKKIASGLRAVTWRGDSARLCATTSRDAHWIDLEKLELVASTIGCVPEAAAWIDSTQSWAIPNGETFLTYPDPTGNSTPKSSTSWEPKRSSLKGGALIELASADGDRLALYSGQHMQFSQSGNPPDPAQSFDINSRDRAFQGLVWDRGARFLTILLGSEDSSLFAESWSTSGSSEMVSQFETHAQNITTGSRPGTLICRSEAEGIFEISIESGRSSIIDSSRQARQRAPIAVSHDGEWIAAATDFGTIRLLDAASRQHYADLEAPRRARAKSLSWSPDGQHLAVLTDDGFIQLWSLAAWRDWISSNLNT